jgi:Asp-tRNA(Asn)/Glu-tRNA(Gln) amidotransferase A subunit family amidase
MIGYDSINLPIGVQIEAGMWNEDVLIKVAHVLDEEVTSKIRRKPQAFYPPF